VQFLVFALPGTVDLEHDEDRLCPGIVGPFKEVNSMAHGFTNRKNSDASAVGTAIQFVFIEPLTVCQSGGFNLGVRWSTRPGTAVQVSCKFPFVYAIAVKGKPEICTTLTSSRPSAVGSSRKPNWRTVVLAVAVTVNWRFLQAIAGLLPKAGRLFVE
jgi:hypothetical protein